MTYTERELLDQLYFGKITKEEFVKLFPQDILGSNEYAISELKKALEDENAEDVELLLLIGVVNNTLLQSVEYVALLCELLGKSWHTQHENIAMSLSGNNLVGVAEALYKTALNKYDYLEYDDTHSLALKCIYSLAKINTIESVRYLTILSNSEDEFVKKSALAQLNLKA